MSMFKVAAGVGHLDGGDLAPVSPVVDTGAAHSMLPESLMTRLRIAPRQQLGFILADGSRVRVRLRVRPFQHRRRRTPLPRHLRP